MLKVKLLKDTAKLPTVAHAGEDLGYDLYAVEDTLISSAPTKVSTGIAVEDQLGHGFLLKDRSSMASKGLFTHGGVIDAGYRGEIIVIFTSIVGDYVVRAGEKIAQMIPVLPATTEIYKVNELSDSSRKDKGFGSSGE